MKKTSSKSVRRVYEPPEICVICPMDAVRHLLATSIGQFNDMDYGGDLGGDSGNSGSFSDMGSGGDLGGNSGTGGSFGDMGSGGDLGGNSGTGGGFSDMGWGGDLGSFVTGNGN